MAPKCNPQAAVGRLDSGEGDGVSGLWLFRGTSEGKGSCRPDNEWGPWGISLFVLASPLYAPLSSLNLTLSLFLALSLFYLLLLISFSTILSIIICHHTYTHLIHLRGKTIIRRD